VDWDSASQKDGKDGFSQSRYTYSSSYLWKEGVKVEKGKRKPCIFDGTFFKTHLYASSI